MLLDRGPIDPIDVDALLVRSSLPPLDGTVAELAATFDAHERAIAAQQLIMAGDDTRGGVDGGGLDLAIAEDELARQTGALDSSVGNLAAAAGVQGDQIPGLVSDTAGDLEAATPDIGGFVPHAPDYSAFPPPPPIGEGPNPEPPPEPPPPGGTFGEWLTTQYQKYLHRDAGNADVNAWFPTYPNLDRIVAGILGSGEYAQKVDQLYQAWFGRDAQGDELAAARSQQWTLDQVEADLRRRA